MVAEFVDLPAMTDLAAGYSHLIMTDGSRVWALGRRGGVDVGGAGAGGAAEEPWLQPREVGAAGGGRSASKQEHLSIPLKKRVCALCSSVRCAVNQCHTTLAPCRCCGWRTTGWRRWRRAALPRPPSAAAVGCTCGAHC